MERLLAVQAGEVEALEDVQRLADGRAAARGRPHAVDVEAAVSDVRGRPLDRGYAPRSPTVIADRPYFRVLPGTTGGFRTVSTIARASFPE